jgi:hypothetical protein
MNRRSLNKPLRKRVLILCEGESEKIYLNGLKSDYFNRNSLSGVKIEILSPDSNPMGLVEEARRRIKKERSAYPYDSVWIVFDKDTHSSIPEAFDIARRNNPPINIAFSNICFEYWVLLHFEQTNRAFQSCDALVSYFKQRRYIDYQKTKNNYLLLKPSLETALRNAIWLRERNQFDIDSGIHPMNLNAYTDFDRLSVFLIDLS